MATIQLNPNYSPRRLAVGSTTVSIKVTGGEDFTKGYKDTSETEYQKCKNIYTFNYYIDDEKKFTSYTVSGTSGNDGEITITLYGLSAGTSNYITVSIAYSYEYREQQDEAWGDWTVKGGSKGTASLYVYTRNSAASGQFWLYQHPTAGPIAIAKGEYIYHHITTTNVDQWLVQLGIWSSWREQDDNYSSYNSYTGITTVTVPNLNGSGTITLKTPTSGNNITASWYRNCGNACGLSNMSSIKGLSDNGVAAENATYIKSSHFTNLAEAVIDWT